MAKKAALRLSTDERVVRVFVSSTFRDMQAERDELIKRTFPQLRKLCEQRGVAWSEVDLRWGITEQQSQSGEVLPICLAEIQRCRPYFIGLLGERYGWVPDEIAPELIEQESWLTRHRQHSVTELEILHGVLNEPSMADHALFYFRDRGFIESLPPDRQRDYLELPSVEEIEKLGQAEADRRAADRRERLRALKDRIKESGLPFRENYANPRALGEMVHADMADIIERLYPKGSEPDPLEREAREHEAFARSLSRVYIGRQEYFDHLDAHARGSGPPLVVLGEAGSGKSALLAKWGLQYRKSHKKQFVLIHFIGASAQSAEWASMLRRVMGEVKRRLGIDQEIPDQPDALRTAFANWLHMAAAKGRMVLIFDGLDQLEDRDAALDLGWLPPQVPPKVRLIVSTLPGRPLDELKRRDWPAIHVEPLDADERSKLIGEYLAQYSKRLGEPRTERIASADQTSNPLFLRALLDELRVFGIHEELDARIGNYLAAANPDELYQKILDRYEQDYERDRPGLVKDAMSLLWAARRGLSESELMDLLGARDQPLPRAHWSPLYLAAEQSLVSRSGLLGFSHDYFRRAVHDRYLPVEHEQRDAHLRLVEYFAEGEPGMRKIDELPWQLAKAKSWDRLAALLSDRAFLVAAWEAAMFDVSTYWTEIERNSTITLPDTYRDVAESPDADENYLWCVATLFELRGHRDKAYPLRRRLADYYRETRNRRKLANALANQAMVLLGWGRLDESMAWFKEAERLHREFDDKDGLQSAIGNQALIQQARGNLDEAWRLLEEKELLCREIGNRKGLAIALGNLAAISHADGDLAQAKALFKEQEQIFRESGDKFGLSVCLGNQAVLLHESGRSAEALNLLKRQEETCRELGHQDGLAGAIGKQAAVLYSQGEFGQSMDLHRQEMEILQRTGNKAALLINYRNQVPVAMQLGNFTRVAALNAAIQELSNELGVEGDVAGSASDLFRAIFGADSDELS